MRSQQADPRLAVIAALEVVEEPLGFGHSGGAAAEEDAQVRVAGRAYEAGLPAGFEDSVELAVSNSAGFDVELRTDYICVTAGALGGVDGLTFSGSDAFFWNSTAGATAYDVIKGNLVPLVDSDGAFSTAGMICLENDDEDLQAQDPLVPGAQHRRFSLDGKGSGEVPPPLAPSHRRGRTISDHPDTKSILLRLPILLSQVSF